MNLQEAKKKAVVSFGGDELAANVFFKYSLVDQDGDYKESSLKEMYSRLSNELDSCEKNTFNSDVSFGKLFDEGRFIFAGRVLYALGNPYDKTATYSNCYVTDIAGDSIEEIFETAKRQARVFSRGGGIGFDLSMLRPKGAPVNNSAKSTTGAVSFMDLFSLVTGLIGQHGRRGALMLSISCEHPDLIDFIKVKGGVDKKKIEFANISVRVTNAFMQAVVDDTDWEMKYSLKDGTEFKKTEKAKFIWSLLVESNRIGAEPGILFWDEILSDPSAVFRETRAISTNPCLAGDTMVSVRDKRTDPDAENPIQEIEFSHLVEDGNFTNYQILTKNLETCEKELESIVWGGKTKEKAFVIKLNLENGEELVLTPDHPVLTKNRGWQKAGLLTCEDELVDD